jgi:hypothetical protein
MLKINSQNNRPFFLLFVTLIIFISISIPVEAASPKVEISTSFPSEITPESTQQLIVEISETGGLDWIKDGSVQISVSPPDGIYLSKSLVEFGRIDKLSSTSLSFPITILDYAPSGQKVVYISVQYREPDLFNIDTYSHTTSLTKTFYVKSIYGKIGFSSNPSGANVYLDGVYKGITPITLQNVLIGSHTVKLTKSGYNDISSTVTVSSGQTASVSKTLTTQTGSISVSSNPSGANVYLDGTHKGTTPTTLYNVPTGSHTVKLTKSGYNDVSSTVTVSSDRTASISKTLLAPPKPSAPPEPSVLPKLPAPEEEDASLIIVGAIFLLLIFGIVGMIIKKSKNTISPILPTIVKPIEEKQSNTPIIEKQETKSLNTIEVKSAFSYKDAIILYKIKVENPTLEPIGDIKVNLYVPDVFLVSESTKSIAMLKPSESKTATFEIRPTGECGDCEVSGKVVYYDYSTKKTSEIEIPAKNLSIVCPMLHSKEISEDTWSNALSGFVKAEESTKEIDMPASPLFDIITDILQDMNLYMLEPKIKLLNFMAKVSKI